MEKERTLEKIKQQKLVAVIRGKDMEDGVKTSEACIDGGVKLIEVAFTTPQAHDVIRTLKTKHAVDDDVCIGAGTVLDAVTARIAILAGADFVVSPAFDLETIRLCNRYRIPCMPGTTSIDGVLHALEAGADIIKIFPGEIAGVQLIKAIHGPLPQAQLMPTGGVNLDNMWDWLDAGCVAVGAGGSLTGAAKHGDYAAVTETAKAFSAKIRSRA